MYFFGCDHRFFLIKKRELDESYIFVTIKRIGCPDPNNPIIFTDKIMIKALRNTQSRIRPRFSTIYTVENADAQILLDMDFRKNPGGQLYGYSIYILFFGTIVRVITDVQDDSRLIQEVTYNPVTKILDFTIHWDVFEGGFNYRIDLNTPYEIIFISGFYAVNIDTLVYRSYDFIRDASNASISNITSNINQSNTLSVLPQTTQSQTQSQSQSQPQSQSQSQAQSQPNRTINQLQTQSQLQPNQTINQLSEHTINSDITEEIQYFHQILKNNKINLCSPVILAQARLGSQGSNLGNVLYLIVDSFYHKDGYYYLSDPILYYWSYRYGTIYSTYPQINKVLNAPGDTLYNIIDELIFLYKVTTPYLDFIENIISYSSSIYILSALIYGSFSVKYLLRKNYEKFIRDLENSRYYKFLELYENPKSNIYGYKKYFKRDFIFENNNLLPGTNDNNNNIYKCQLIINPKFT